jgi:methionyl-tRNA formyltransferase
VVSQPDRRRGRGSATAPSPVKAAALELGLPVTDTVADVVAAGWTSAWCVAYGRSSARPCSAAVPMVNLHFSLLPGGGAPPPSSGPCWPVTRRPGVLPSCSSRRGSTPARCSPCETVPIGAEEPADELRDRLVAVGSRCSSTPSCPASASRPPGRCPHRRPPRSTPPSSSSGWERPAVELHRPDPARSGVDHLPRAAPQGGARHARPRATEPGPPGTIGADGLTVATGAGSLRLVEVQPEGKAPQPADAWRNGARPGPDDRLGT